MTTDKSEYDEHVSTLKMVLESITMCDHDDPVDYDQRERFVYAALYEAKRAGLECGFRIDPNEPEWPVAYVELPTGQISWHMPQHEKPYDGHTTKEKYERIARWTTP